MSGPDVQPVGAPIAVFAYNRPDKLAAMLSSLQQCRGIEEAPVTVFVDGPRNQRDAVSVKAVQDVISGFSSPNVSTRLRQKNLGLRRSIFSGVSEILEKSETVIVLEDDLVLSPIALEYFNRALAHYADVERVWSIAGYAYDVPALRDASSTVALPFAHPWGWATWRRAWRTFDLANRPTVEQLEAQAFRSAFDMNGLYPFSRQLKNSIDGRVDSWFIHWYFTVFQNGGVSIFPPRRVLDNFGFNDGSHGGRMNPYDRLVKRPDLLAVVPNFCDTPTVDYAVLDALKRSYELRVQRFIAHAGSVKRFMKSMG